MVPKHHSVVPWCNDFLCGEGKNQAVGGLKLKIDIGRPYLISKTFVAILGNTVPVDLSVLETIVILLV